MLMAQLRFVAVETAGRAFESYVKVFIARFFLGLFHSQIISFDSSLDRISLPSSFGHVHGTCARGSARSRRSPQCCLLQSLDDSVSATRFFRPR